MELVIVGADLLVGSAILHPQRTRPHPAVRRVSLRALMHQFLNKRKDTSSTTTTTPPEPGPLGRRRSPTWQPDAHLGTEQPLTPPVPNTMVSSGMLLHNLCSLGCVGNFPDNGARAATAIVILISNSVQKSQRAKIYQPFLRRHKSRPSPPGFPPTCTP